MKHKHLYLLAILVLLFSCFISGKNRCKVCDNKLQECPWCSGSGDCTECDSEGYHVCDNCGGNPACRYCTDGTCQYCIENDGYASALQSCFSCNGNGECRSCDGIGVRFVLDYARTCVSCYGKGWCWRCGGDGEYRPYGEDKCNSCDGTMQCKYCGGDRIRCENCIDGVVPCGHNNDCVRCEGEGKLCFVCKNIVVETKKSQTIDSGKSNWNDFHWDTFDNCSNCGGLGRSKCYDCVTGSCIECGGDGEIPHYTYGEVKYTDCSYCVGGNCRSCNGTGEADCPYC